MRLLMIRHGQSHHALNGTAAGLRGCGGLTDLGRQQAALLAQRLSAEHVEAAAVISSPVRRAAETAAAVQAAVGAPTVIQACDVGEMHLGGRR